MTWQVLPIGVTAMGQSGETAKGTFDVKLVPLEGAVIGRMSIYKSFVGDLVATSVGEMLAMRTAVKGSAGYVAKEKVTGTMAGGKQELSVTVAPDSGTEGLTGLSGRMAIIIEGKKQSYEFVYALPAEHRENGGRRAR